MNIVKQGETARRETTVDGDTVVCHHVTLNKPTDSHYQLCWKFDFKDVTNEQLLELATKHLVIQMRPQFKNDKEPGDKWDGKNFSVSAYLAKEGRRKSQLEKAAVATAKLSDDEKEFLMQQLMDELKEEG